MLVMAYIPCPSKKHAESIGKKLVEEKLVACANVLSPVATTYTWNRKTEHKKEALLICKTLKQKMPAVEKRVKQLHPYDVPCIAFYNAEGVNAEYLKWVESVVS